MIDTALYDYSPALRLKAGEYLGLSDLRPDIAAHIIPYLIAPPPKERDPEKHRPLTPEEMVHETGRRIGRYWTHRPCFIDGRYLFDALGEAEAEVWFPKLVRVAVSASGRPIVAASLSDFEGPRAHGLVAGLQEASSGLGLRLTLNDLADPRLTERVHALLLRTTRCKPTDCTLVLDMSQADLGLPDLEETLAFHFAQVTEIGLWASVVYQGTNYPESNPAKAGERALVQRREWDLWVSAGALDPVLRRGLTFGDFGPDSAKFVFGGKARTIPHYRYATSQTWRVDRGKKEETMASAMSRIARELVGSTDFAGRGFSRADRLIDDTALGLCGPGNATTWRRINVCHHLTRVVSDLAPLLGFGIQHRAEDRPAPQASLFDANSRN